MKQFSILLIGLAGILCPLKGNSQVGDSALPAKIKHIEPLYVDLIRDLGARKGEREWNIGVGSAHLNDHVELTTLVEYEFAPINRLGFEVEIPFTFSVGSREQEEPLPGNRLDGLKLATQYTFLVAPGWNTSAAIGYLNEFELTSFNRYGKEQIVRANLMHPFLVVAKSWKNNMHTMLITGPEWEKEMHSSKTEFYYHLNGSIHYSVPATKSVIGLEVNTLFAHEFTSVVLRPQMRVTVSKTSKIGLVAGIPMDTRYDSYSFFVRWIYEPPMKKFKS
ncbi:MAG: HAEPLYID family protein [Fluviicola sp.]